MDDLISRQAAIYTALRAISDLQGKDSLRDEYIVSEMEEISSAERRGRWIYKSELYSYCGHPFYPKICSVCNGVFEYTTNYCPNCGAKMDEVTE